MHLSSIHLYITVAVPFRALNREDMRGTATEQTLNIEQILIPFITTLLFNNFAKVAFRQ